MVPFRKVCILTLVTTFSSSQIRFCHQEINRWAHPFPFPLVQCNQEQPINLIISIHFHKIFFKVFNTLSPRNLPHINTWLGVPNSNISSLCIFVVTCLQTAFGLKIETSALPWVPSLLAGTAKFWLTSPHVSQSLKIKCSLYIHLIGSVSVENIG